MTKPGPTTVIYDWDDNGNLTDRDSDEFTWDFEDRMTSATVNSVTTTSTYRGDGLRNSRTVGGGSPTVFTWDIAASLAVVLDDGNQYVYGAAGLTSMKQSGDWYYYLADGLGSTMAMVDDTGTVQKSYTYDVYGEATPTGGLANEFDFAGQQTDTSTGLQYLRARYMDPETGVFISRDPLAIEPSILEPLYGYAMANPSNYTDPHGLCSWYDVSCHIKEALGLNDAEYSYCARGPFTLNRCRQARDDANSAVVIVESLFGDEDSDRTAALRHCLWSGFMTCRWGSGQAKIFGDLHEASETDPNRKKQAFWNNEVGRVIGDYFRGRANATQLIADECIRALNDGRLINDRKFFQKVVK